MSRRIFATVLALALCDCAPAAESRGSNGSSAAGGSGGAGDSGGAGASSSAGAPGSSWLDQPAELPDTLEQTGLFSDLTDLESYHERAILYRPEHELWSNGSVKQRLLVLPDGSQVDSQDREAWQFPEHTLFFKTFSYQDAAAADGLRPIETRVLQKTAEGWDYHVYLWSKERDTARLLDGIYTTPVEVESAGETFDHVVPARLDCRKCHESQPVAVIGFDELRLNAPLHGAESETQLTRLGAQGILSDVAETPDMVRHSDPTTEQVLGYLHGNCAHCHNGWDGPSSAFDMRHAAALKNLINVETTSELLSGLRLAPGSAQDSAIYRAMARDPSFPDAAAMPPVGVDLVDRDAVLLLQSWIDDM